MCVCVCVRERETEQKHQFNPNTVQVLLYFLLLDSEQRYSRHTGHSPGVTEEPALDRVVWLLSVLLTVKRT